MGLWAYAHGPLVQYTAEGAEDLEALMRSLPILLRSMTRKPAVRTTVPQKSPLKFLSALVIISLSSGRYASRDDEHRSSHWGSGQPETSDRRRCLDTPCDSSIEPREGGSD